MALVIIINLQISIVENLFQAFTKFVTLTGVLNSPNNN